MVVIFRHCGWAFYWKDYSTIGGDLRRCLVQPPLRSEQAARGFIHSALGSFRGWTRHNLFTGTIGDGAVCAGPDTSLQRLMSMEALTGWCSVCTSKSVNASSVHGTPGAMFARTRRLFTNKLKYSDSKAKLSHISDILDVLLIEATLLNLSCTLCT